MRVAAPARTDAAAERHSPTVALPIGAGAIACAVAIVFVAQFALAAGTDAVVFAGMFIGALMLAIIAAVLAAVRPARRAVALVGFAVPILLAGAFVWQRMGDYPGSGAPVSTGLVVGGALFVVAGLRMSTNSQPTSLRWLLIGLAAGLLFTVGVGFATLAWLFRGG